MGENPTPRADVFVEGIGWVRAEDVPAALVVAGVNIEELSDAPIDDESEW